jgi:calcineurin-like phosphoesterase family protein
MKQVRKPIFFTSDWHIGHANSIVFDDRPFKDLDHMHQVLINNYNAVVPEDGICYHLGDVGMANVETLSGVLSQLNGTKVLVLGNHDGNVNRMYRLGFDVVLYGATLYIAGEEVTLTHCPLRGIFREDITGMRGVVDGDLWHGEHKQIRFSTEDRGQFHLHGHIHSSKANGKLTKDGKQWDIGVCANDYRPVSISKVESWISKYKQKEKDELKISNR